MSSSCRVGLMALHWTSKKSVTSWTLQNVSSSLVHSVLHWGSVPKPYEYQPDQWSRRPTVCKNILKNNHFNRWHVTPYSFDDSCRTCAGQLSRVCVSLCVFPASIQVYWWPTRHFYSIISDGLLSVMTAFRKVSRVTASFTEITLCP